MKKDKSYAFVFDGKLLEHESLLSLRTEVSVDEWCIIVAQTTDFYLQMEAIHKSKTLFLEKNDINIMRVLKRTLLFIKKLDPVVYDKFYTNELRDHYRQVVMKEINATKPLQIKYGGKPDGTSDIIVSRLDA